MNECKCMTPPFNYTDFDTKFIGIDETNGRFGEVSVKTCKLCGSEWLHYLVQYEAFTASGRWYRGLVSQEILKTVIPETAVEILERLPWHFFGGSYFKSTGQKGVSQIFVDN
jgi:hypothetical protein